jgi:indole-3-glycerol phosphate synthase
VSSDFLDKIIEHKKFVNHEKRGLYKNLKDNLSRTEYSRYGIFKKQISQDNGINLIAELKKASPSKGIIREDFNLIELAKICEKAGAAAISVLTEDKYFLGKPGFVKDVAEAVGPPTLTKDFIIEEGQIYEAAYNGASAVLLIVALLSVDEIKKLMAVASSLDIDCLVEIHNEEELNQALEAGAEIIGINNRDLKTFVVDLKNCDRLIPLIPKDKVIVAESGIKTSEDIKHLQEIGANAVLIGETFMRQADVGAKIKELLGK